MMKSNSGMDQQRVSREDGPEYRSVMIQPLATPIQARDMAPLPKLKKSTFSGFANSCSNKKRGLNESSPIVHRWRVQELSALSADYVLTRTNVYVNDASPQEIADRICLALKTLSIAINDSSNSFDEENDLHLETHQGVKLVTRMFNDNDMVVVEVQRHAGCAFEFRDVAKSILRSAKGLQLKRLPASRRYTIPHTLPKRSLEMHHKCIRDDFQIAYTMLHSNKSDAQVLALESMEKMTKSCEGRDIAAKSVLGDYSCLKQLLSLLGTYNNNELASSEMKSIHSSVLRRKIFGVIANSCEAISECELADILSSRDNDLKTRSFLTMLLVSLQEAPVRPHDAFEAVRCLRHLLISKEVESAMIDMSAMDVITTAHSAGLVSHQGLEQESTKLMLRLQNAC